MMKKFRIKLFRGFYAFAVVTIFIMAVGPNFRALADCNFRLSPTLDGDCNLSQDTNFSCLAGQKTEAQLLISTNGSYAYCEVDHVVFNTAGWPSTWVYDIGHVSCSAIGTNFWSRQINVGDYEQASSYSGANELIAVQYIPDSRYDAPPTSISFQEIFFVQGQITSGYVGGLQIGARVQTEPDEYAALNYPQELNTAGVTFSFSDTILGDVISRVPIAASGPFNPGTFIDNRYATYITSVFLEVETQWIDPAWATTNASDFYGYDASWTQPNSYNISSYSLGFTNIVDQSNNPVPPNKLVFWVVDPNSTNAAAAMPLQSSLSAQQQFVSLQAIPSTNGLTIQWPLYASNFQLQTTGDLLNGAWKTNSLPAPIQTGPFLQVSVPMTNCASFFRLVQTN